MYKEVSTQPQIQPPPFPLKRADFVSFYSYNLEKHHHTLGINFSLKSEEMPAAVELNCPLPKTLRANPAPRDSMREVTGFICETKHTTLPILGSKSFLAEHLVLNEVILLADGRES